MFQLFDLCTMHYHPREADADPAGYAKLQAMAKQYGFEPANWIENRLMGRDRDIFSFDAGAAVGRLVRDGTGSTRFWGDLSPDDPNATPRGEFTPANRGPAVFTVLDRENFPYRANLSDLEQFCEGFRSEAAGVRVGLYCGSGWPLGTVTPLTMGRQFITKPTADLKRNLAEAIDATRPIIKKYIDVLVPGFYRWGPTTRMEDVSFFRSELTRMKTFDKPIAPLMFPRFDCVQGPIADKPPVPAIELEEVVEVCVERGCIGVGAWSLFDETLPTLWDAMKAVGASN